jgi:peptidoglycan/LPS O-acetylase OafA/YrhL
VLTTHVAFWTGSYSFDLTGTALSRLDVGVAIFFVLSGFLLSRPVLARAREGRPAPPLGAYLRKRALRVLPVYWVVAVVALVVLQENHRGPLGWLRTLTLTDLYFADRLPAALTQMWSITTEVAFYLVLPALLLGWNRITRARRSDATVLALVLLSAGVSLLWVTHAPSWLGGDATFHDQWLPTYLVWFVVGIALAHVHVHRDEPATGRIDLVGPITRLGAQPGACWAIVVATFLAAATPMAGPALLVPSEPAHIVTKTLLYAVVGGGIVLASAFAPGEGTYQRLMGHPVGRHLGRISYCVFCVHVLVLHLIELTTSWQPFTGHGWTIFVVTLVASLLLAEALHALVEAPVMRWRPRGEPPPAVTASSPSGATLSS